MGFGALAHRAAVNVQVKATSSTGLLLSDEVYTITDGLVPSWAAAPYRGAMNLPGAWRASLIASELLGSLPWVAHERDPSGVDVPLAVQPGILAQMAPPDPMITTLSSFGLDYIWHGNAIAIRGELDQDGHVEVAVPVPIGAVAIGRSNGRDGTDLRRGEVGYRIGNRVYRADEVIHIKGPCEPGALRGLGAIEVHLPGAIASGLELERQASNLSAAGVPTGALKVNAPDLTSAEANAIKASWLAAQRDRTVAVLNDVTDFEPLAWNPTESQLLEARKFNLHQLALMVGVPLYFLGVETSNRTYSNVEQEGIVLTRYHLAGAIGRFEAALTGCMRPGVRVLPDLTAVLRNDTLTRFQAWQIARTSGIMTANEIRKYENLPPAPGGDVLAPTAPPGAEPAGSGSEPGGSPGSGAGPAGSPADVEDADPRPPEIGDGGLTQGRGEQS